MQTGAGSTTVLLKTASETKNGFKSSVQQWSRARNSAFSRARTTNTRARTAFTQMMVCPALIIAVIHESLFPAIASDVLTTSSHHASDALQLDFVTNGPYGDNFGSRTYLMRDENTYEMFHLKNREFTFDVDVSALPCGVNGALYFVQMDADGGMSRFPSNEAGAKHGTGYCDAQVGKQPLPP
jgi:hypothetical protein